MNIGESASHEKSGALMLANMPVFLSVKNGTGKDQ